MRKGSTGATRQQLAAENEELRARLQEAEDTLLAIRSGDVDALVVSGAGGDRIFTLSGADRSYRVLVEDMSEGALTLTVDGVILYANRRFAEMVKRPLEKVIGATLVTWIVPENQATLAALLRKDGAEKRRAELALIASDETPVPVHLSVNRLSLDEHLDSFCVVATDLAELKRAAAIKDEFMAAVSHELRTPLTGVLGMAEALEMQFSGPLNERQLRFVRNIRESGERLLSMVNGIMRYTSLLAGQVKLQSESWRLDEICAIALRSVHAHAEEKHQTIELSIDPVGVTIVCDGGEIILMLQHLLDNAVKFTPDGGRIGLTACSSVNGNSLTLVVWDTGIGIATEKQATIFHPFVQGDGSLARQYEGIGLGLAYVQRMVELMGGTIVLESAPGAGSRFTLNLPITPARLPTT